MKFGNRFAGAAMAAAMAVGGCDTVQEAGYFTQVDQPDGTRKAVWTTGEPALVAAPPPLKPMVASPAQTARIEQAGDLKEVVFDGGNWRLTETAPSTWTLFDTRAKPVTTLRPTGVTQDMIELGNEDRTYVLHVYPNRKMIQRKQGGDMIDWKAIESFTPGPIVTGRTLTYASFGPANARFEQSGLKEWTEYGGDGKPMGKFTETKRDERVVHLSTDGGAKTIQLDTFRRMIMLGMNGAAPVDYYRITAAETPFVAVAGSVPTAAATVQATNLTSIDLPGSTIALQDTGDWAYLDQLGAPQRFFKEVRREGSSIHLADPQNRESFEINLATMKFATTQGAQSRFEDILRTSATVAPRFVPEGVNGQNLARVSIEPGGFARLYASSDGTWTQVDTNGGVGAVFRETGRDDWSVYLGNDDGERLQIDVYRKVVGHAPAGQPITDKWKILSAARLSPAAARAPAPSLTGMNIRKFRLADDSVFELQDDTWFRTRDGKPVASYRSHSKRADMHVMMDGQGRMYGIDVVRKVFVDERDGPVEAGSFSAAP